MAATQRNSYSFKEGLTMMAAKAIGVDPYLAAEAGENARATINAIRNAAKTKAPKDRAGFIREAQNELRSISAAQHPKLVNALQAKLLALQGRGGDTQVAHVEPGEMVIPRAMLTPEVMRMIAAEADRRGIDPRRLLVGGKGSINPATGEEEFGFDDELDMTGVGPVSVTRRHAGLGLLVPQAERRRDPSELSSSDAIKQFIVNKEGGQPDKCYDSPENDGTKTCGWGHKMQPGEEWDATKAAEIRDRDIMAAEDRVRRLVKVPLFQNEYDSLTSHAFSSREKPDPSRAGSVGWSNSKMLKNLNEGDYEGGFKQMLDWTGGKNAKLGGLTTRRGQEYRWGTSGPLDNY